jgi:hypothetical protein
MNEEHLKVCFTLGIRIAEHVHGICRTGDDKKHDEIFKVLKAVANGDLTLLSTPEEIKASLPTPPAGIKVKFDDAMFREMIRNGRESDKIAAQMLLKILPP